MLMSAMSFTSTAMRLVSFSCLRFVQQGRLPRAKDGRARSQGPWWWTPTSSPGAAAGRPAEASRWIMRASGDCRPPIYYTTGPMKKRTTSRYLCILKICRYTSTVPIPYVTRYGIYGYVLFSDGQRDLRS